MGKITNWLRRLPHWNHRHEKSSRVEKPSIRHQLKTEVSNGQVLKNSKTTVLSGSKKMSQFQGEADAVKQLIQTDPHVNLRAKFNELEKLFREIEFMDTDTAWVQRADLLDAIDVIVHYNSLFKPLSPCTPEKNSRKRLKGEVLLVPYQQIKAQNEDAFESEHTKTAEMVQRWTKRENRMGRVYALFYRLVTKFLGAHYYKNATTAQIAKFSRGMGISSCEVVTQKDDQGHYFDVYRGPRYLFNKSVHEFETVNEWFVRDLTPEGRTDYLSIVTRKEEKLKRQGIRSENLVVVANSNSRIREKSIQPGHFGDPQVITGKVLNAEEAAKAKAKGDNPCYYEEKYQFSTKNLLGRETNDSMETGAFQQTTLSKKMDALLKKIERLSEDSKKRKALQSKYDQIAGRAGRHELLGCVWRYFNQQGATQIIQRLAPADIHHYVAPLQGKPMSQAEAAQYFMDRASSVEESALLKKLKSLFESEEESNATINIAGTNASVSTPAVRNQPRILAQNDRKVMLFRHPDGAVSLHVFIGATGVNRVDVQQQTKQTMERGADQGLMAFGNPRTEEKTIDLGEWQGGFPINGSTVISYYLPTDFHPLPKIASVSEVFTDPDDPLEALEIKSKMGMPLLVKTEVLYTQVLKRTFSSELLNSWDQMLRRIRLGEWDASQSAKQYDSQLLEELRDLFNVEAPSDEQKALIQRLKEMVQS